MEAPKHKRRKRPFGTACTRCRDRYQKCVNLTETLCVRCSESEAVLDFPCDVGVVKTKKDRGNKHAKRVAKRIALENPSITLSTKADDDVLSIHIPRPNQVQPVQAQSISPGLSSIAKEREESELLVICQGCGRNKPSKGSQKSKKKWIECAIAGCGAWYHVSCLLHSEGFPHLLFMSPNELAEPFFICTACLRQPGQGYKTQIAKAKARFMDVIESPEHTSDCTTKASKDALSYISFGPVEKTKYQGCDKDTVEDLIRKIHRSVENYDLEVRSNITRFNGEDNPFFQKPLAAWEFVDVGKGNANEKPWFELDDVGCKQALWHAPITTALRKMLKTPAGGALSITPDVESVNFSLVHRGLITWFAFDVISNATPLYNLPNMKPTLALMSAIWSAVEDRSEGSGHRFLREIRLRAWDKPHFQAAVLSTEEMFTRKLENFLEPLTKSFGPIIQHSIAKSDIIKHTILLWSYLQSLGGRLELIEPTIGEPFDKQSAQPYDKNGNQILHSPTDLSERTVDWVISRGFRYFEEESVKGQLPFTIKAQVALSEVTLPSITIK